MKHIMILLFALVLAGCGDPGAVKDRTIQVDSSDTAMNAAITEARATLSGFLAKAKNPPANTQNYAIKVKIEDEHGIEHFWVTPFSEKGAGFTGIISNDPEVVRSVRAGQRYDFSREDVSDWMYMQDGKIHGGYTIRALLPTLPKAEADQYRAMLADL